MRGWVLLLVVLSGGAVDACQLSEWQQKILDKHNEWRASTSPPAKDMHRVRWDSTIAANMQRWLDRCDSNWPHSDQDRDRKDVGGYDYLGENLAYCAGSACEGLLSDGIPGYLGQSWWDEHKDYDWATDSSNGGVTSHYTQMASSNIYAIGCAAVKCPGPGPWGWEGEWWEFGCQYGPRGRGYWQGTKPFERGDGGLIEPPSDVFSKHPGLCNDGEGPTPPTPATPTPRTPAPRTRPPSTPAPPTPPTTPPPRTPAPRTRPPRTPAPPTPPTTTTPPPRTPAPRTRPPRRTPTPTPAPRPTPPSGTCPATCYGRECTGWAPRYSCEVLERRYGCDCTGCECEAASKCPATCYRRSCDFWVSRGYSCRTLQRRYSCDCSGCTCRRSPYRAAVLPGDETDSLPAVGLEAGGSPILPLMLGGLGVGVVLAAVVGVVRRMRRKTGPPSATDADSELHEKLADDK